MSNLQPGPLRDYYEQLLKAHRRSNKPSSNPNPLSLEDVENDFDEEEELTSDDGVVLDPEIAEQDNEVKYMNNCFAPKSKPRRADIPEVTFLRLILDLKKTFRSGLKSKTVTIHRL